MSWWRERKYFKDRTSRVFGADRLSKIEIPTLFAGIQAAGGAAFAYYLLEDPEYKLLPYMCSAVAIVGTYQLLKSKRNKSLETKNKPRSDFSETPRRSRRVMKHPTVWSLVTGIFTYATNIYIISEGLKLNDKMWIPSIAIAASGYYFAVSFIDNMKTNLFRNAVLYCCKLIFEPALITATSVYLLKFRNHQEDCLYWIPFVCIATSGFKIATRGYNRVETIFPHKLAFVTPIEILTGGCLLVIGCITLTTYTSVNDFNMLCIAFSAIGSIFGVFVIFGSITYFQRYVDLDQKVFFSIVGMIIVPIAFISSCVMVKCVKTVFMVYMICIFLAGFGHVLVFKSVLNEYNVVFERDVYVYCQRVLGPVLIIYGCFATSYVGNRKGWWFSLALMPFIPAGMYVTYKGYREIEGDAYRLNEMYWYIKSYPNP